MNSRSFSIQFFIVALLLTVSVYALDAATSLKNAFKALDDEVAKSVIPEIVANKNNITYPVTAPRLSPVDVFRIALEEVDDELAKSGLLKSDEELFLEINKELKPFKIGERIKVTPNVRYKRTIVGRYQGKNHLGHVHIGSNWIPLSDFDPDTAARFDEEQCNELIKKKFNQAKHKQKLQLDALRRSSTTRAVKNNMAKHGYVPKIRDEYSPQFLDVSNWESQKKRLNDLIEREKARVKEAIEEEFIDKYMTEHGFEYDEDKEEWRSRD